jgi:hypothetical protein
MTERDKKVLAIVIAVVVLGGYWFLVLGKKRSAIKEAETAQIAAQQELDATRAAEQKALVTAKVKPAAYSRLMRLGKAIPQDKDFESLLVQINAVSLDSNVQFVSLSASPGKAGGAGTGATGTTTCDVTGTTGATAGGSTGAASPATGATGASGSTAQTWVGKDRDKAKAAVTASDQANANTEAASNFSCDTAPSLTDIAAQAAGLETESFNFTFNGSFYDLKSVYNGILDLVEVHNAKVSVSGRLLDINSISMAVSEFPNLSATVLMTGYKYADTPAAGTTPAAAAPAAAATAAANTGAGTP